jgi:hypothetical protein
MLVRHGREARPVRLSRCSSAKAAQRWRRS